MSMQTTVKKEWLLERLHENRTLHSKVYAEAREGYILRSKEKLEEKLKDLQSGRITALYFNLTVPSDHTADYDTVIKMLEQDIHDEVTLEANEFRMFVEDEWDWMGDWVTSNAPIPGRRWSTESGRVCCSGR
jgi:hypothetical protein